MSSVRVVLTKYGGRPHRRQTMTRLGEDEHGVWLAAPAGSTVLLGDGTRSFVTRCACVRLIPPSSWWTALFTVDDVWDVYCDVTTPPHWTDSSEVTLVDLDLDLYRSRADQRVELLDQDEFDAHRVRLGYPDALVVQATRVAARLRTAVAEQEPFASHYLAWIDRSGR